MNVARAALSGYVYAPVGLATHYHTVQIHPYWAPSLNYVGTVGAHRFYGFRGAAGRGEAFRFAYLGGEPAPTPHARDDSALAAASVAALDPIAVQRRFEAAPQTAAGTTAGAASQFGPAPSYSSEVLERGGDAIYRAQKLPEARGIKAEYANSGRWISQPTD